MKRIYQVIVSTAVMLSMTTMAIAAETNSTEKDNSMVEIKNISCRNLLKLDDSEKEAAIMFFHGYMSGKKGELIINIPVLSDISDKVMDDCINNPDDTLFNIFEKYRK